jgi:hypothetical protein
MRLTRKNKEGVTMLTTKEQSAKEFLEKLFVPKLHAILKSHSPEKYKRWEGNCCKQTAIFGAFFLSTNMKGYTITTWEGIFEDIEYNKPVKYNHAWIFAKEEATGRRLFIDMARLHRPNIFIEVTKNGYSKDIPGYEHIKEISRTQLNWVEQITKEVEYFSGLKGMDLAMELLTAMALA